MPFPGSTTFPGLLTFPGTASLNPLARYRFAPPFVVRHHRIEGGLIGSLQYGLCVMRINGEWVESEFPSWEQEQAADLVYRGGTVNEVPASAAAALLAAGYEVTEIT